MINVLMALVVLTILVMVNRRLYRYPTWQQLGLLCLLSMVSGILMDWLLGYHLCLWYYVHHKYWSLDYWAYLLPSWAMTLTIYALFYSILECRIKWLWLRAGIFYLTIPFEAEFMGVWRDSWHYDAPIWLFGLGWWLLLTFVIAIKGLTDDWVIKRSKEVKVISANKILEIIK